MKGLKLILAIAATAGLMIGCASHDQDQGGTSNDGFNNATHGTGTSTATNANTGNPNDPNRDGNMAP
jgi:type IV pilus biogenesis protein CpaD/CtpE